MRLRGELVFQFHSGSIKTREHLLAGRVNRARFNSTLVRLRHVERVEVAVLRLDVSIPLWFD